MRNWIMLAELVTSEPEALAEDMMALKDICCLKIFGGCLRNGWKAYEGDCAASGLIADGSICCQTTIIFDYE